MNMKKKIEEEKDAQPVQTTTEETHPSSPLSGYI
jgi:hypothetical protein